MDPTTWRRVPGEGRYARLEIERRFLVTGPVDLGGVGRLIVDRYLDGLRMRLRRVTVDGESIYKLTQKVRPDPSQPSTASVTNIYLSQPEYDQLLALPGRELRKTRRIFQYQGRSFAVDQLQGSLKGLWLAEVEVENLDEALETPTWFGREVTGDDSYSGGQLAR